MLQHWLSTQPQLAGQRVTTCVGYERPSRDMRTNEPSGPCRPHVSGTKCHLAFSIGAPSLLPVLVPSAWKQRESICSSPRCHGSLLIHVPPAELPFEFAMNALRLVDGFTPMQFEHATGLPMAVLDDALDKARAQGLINEEGGRLRASPLGYRHLNRLMGLFL